MSKKNNKKPKKDKKQKKVTEVKKKTKIVEKKEDPKKTKKQGTISIEDSSTQTLQTSDSKAPVLEAIAGEQPQPVFVSRGAPSPTGKEEKAIDYALNEGDNEDPKYSSNTPSKFYDAKTVSTESLGRTPHQPVETQDIDFRNEETATMDSSMQERTWKVERFDEANAGRQDPLSIQEKEIQYKEYEPPK